MSECFVLEVEEDLSVKIPPSLAERLHLERGTKVFAREEDGRVVLTSEERENRERFWRAVQKVREDVKKAGGISVKEIDDIVRKVRAAKGRC